MVDAASIDIMLPFQQHKNKKKLYGDPYHDNVPLTKILLIP